MAMLLSHPTGCADSHSATQPPDDHLDTNSMGKWTDFLTALNAAFKDHTATKKAGDKVEHLFQGKIMIDEFMNNFETLLADTELTDDNKKI